ncbi:50S ribosomal protein L1 [Candidatus Babeliales bacterium]|nr:50S ribosomal protein L1 [Candidatus Babeliales bacterium]
MAYRGKKYRQARTAVSSFDAVSPESALEAVISTAHVRFDETVGLDVVLGVDPTRGEQVVRGTVLLPHGTGKKIRIAVFAKGEQEEAAKSAGADFVGAEDLVEKIAGGWMDFDVAVATPDLMGMVGKVARVLGPRGLLPNKKIGTVTLDVVPVITDLKKGRVSFRNDKGGGLHVAFGKVSFGVEKLTDNLVALLEAVRLSKPASSKGKFIKKAVISSTMGVGVAVAADDVS